MRDIDDFTLGRQAREVSGEVVVVELQHSQARHAADDARHGTAESIVGEVAERQARRKATTCEWPREHVLSQRQRAQSGQTSEASTAASTTT